MPRIVLAIVAAVVIHVTVAPVHAGDDVGVVSYTRLGQAVVFDGGPSPAPAIGFGLRGELEKYAIDVSGLNLAMAFHPVDTPRDMLAGSLLKIEVLRFLSPHSWESAYIGGGLSWGVLSLGRLEATGGSWNGSGLQSEFTVGYELARRSAVRLFVQADASAPLFMGQDQTFVSTAGTATSVVREHRYIPSVVLSAGLGWSRVR